jgi:hypothetical protein
MFFDGLKENVQRDGSGLNVVVSFENFSLNGEARKFSANSARTSTCENILKIQRHFVLLFSMRILIANSAQSSIFGL